MLGRLRQSWWWAPVVTGDTEPAELIGVVLTTLWGIWLLLPMQTFKSSAAYSDLALVPEWLLGSVVLLIGLYKGLALRSGDVRRRRVGALWTFALWFAIASAFAHSDIANTGVVVYGVVAGAAGWVYIRLGVQARALARAAR